MSIAKFKENFDGGTRRNRFKVSPAIRESGSTVLADFSPYHVAAASLPASIITANPIDYQGRKIYYPGDRIYGEASNLWTITILDDIEGSAGSSSLWKQLHTWNKNINGHTTNTSDGNIESLYLAKLTVTQFDLNDNLDLKTATLRYCWPQSISKVDMEMQARDQYSQFEVTFCFRYVEYTDHENQG